MAPLVLQTHFLIFLLGSHITIFFFGKHSFVFVEGGIFDREVVKAMMTRFVSLFFVYRVNYLT